MEEIESEVDLEPLTPLGLGLQVGKNKNSKKLILNILFSNTFYK